MTTTCLYTVERHINGQDVEIELECRFDYTPACRGQRDSCGGVRGAGPPLEPDEPAHCEFLDATTIGTKEEIELTEHEIERATEKANDALNDGD
jgi:hypothetical protein